MCFSETTPGLQTPAVSPRVNPSSGQGSAGWTWLAALTRCLSAHRAPCPPRLPAPCSVLPRPPTVRGQGANNATEAWAKPLPKGAYAVVIFNRGPKAVANVVMPLSATGFTGASGQVSDVWTGAQVPPSPAGASYLSVASLAPHESVFWMVRPNGIGPQ